MTDNLLVQVVIGCCPKCGAKTESAEGLEGLKCARGGHRPVPYEPFDTRYMTQDQIAKEA